MTVLVQLAGVRLTRGGRDLLTGLDLELHRGRSVALLGPSGSGKSSLLAVLAGLEQPDAGTVTRHGDLRLGLVLQGYGLPGVLTAAENVEVALQARGRSRYRTRTDSARALAAVGLDEVADHLVEELSGGQQQRVAIARALVTGPDVLLADEPTAELDGRWAATVLDLTLGVAARGGATVLATHDPAIAARCDQRYEIIDAALHAR